MKRVILSIDAGGIRGVVPLTILAYIENQLHVLKTEHFGTVSLKDDLINYIDFVAGTSSGALTGAMMLIPGKEKNRSKYSINDILQSYFKIGSYIFKSEIKHNLKTLYGLFGSKYPSHNLDDILIQYLDHYKLSQLKRPCMFTGYDIYRRKIHIYTNCDANKTYSSYYIKDIIRGATSIPYYFEPAYFREDLDVQTIIDGGIFAANPSMYAFIELSKTIFNNECEVTNVKPEDMYFISLGTGIKNNVHYKYTKARRWGRKDWMLPIFDMLSSSNIETVTYQMDKIFNSFNVSDNYIRINPILKYGNNSFVDTSKDNMMHLIKDANNYITENKEYLDNIIQTIFHIRYNC